MRAQQIVNTPFIITTVTISCIYLIIIILIKNFLGEEVAGVAGVSLTGLTTALYKKFETVKFEEVNKVRSNSTTTNNINYWNLLAIVCLLYGVAQLVISIRNNIYFFQHIDLLEMRRFIGKGFFSKDNLHLYTQPFAFLSFFIGGYVYGKVWRDPKYSTIITATFLLTLFQFLHFFVTRLIYLKNFEFLKNLLGRELDKYVFAFAYIIFAYLGLLLYFKINNIKSTTARLEKLDYVKE
ncbi:MAG: hypothetical protein JWN56_3062 [Sphingobacteriales bacterium]|nr:hypothetical protein [Sphingobacteriales bacterium]